MLDLVAVSDVVLVGLVSFGGVVVTAMAGIVVAALGRDVKHRRATVNKTVEDFESAWRRRGELLDGLGADLDAAHRRIQNIEEREDECQKRLAHLEATVERRKRARG